MSWPRQVDVTGNTAASIGPPPSPAPRSILLCFDLKIDPKAQAIIFFSDPSAGSGKLLYLTSNVNDATPFKMNSLGFRFRQADQKTWESTVSLENTREETLFGLFGILTMFGFGQFI